jgi:hypothetical protein
MAAGHVEGVSFDHVAHAVPRWHDVWERYAVDLGGVWRFGGYGVGFAPAQLRFANDARVEVLMPYDAEANDFLDRFLFTNGPGSHHLTFKVPDLDVAVERAAVAGFEPIGLRRDDPKWMEAFLHPKDATGVLVQLAEVMAPLVSEAPDDFPHQRRQSREASGTVPPASFVRVVHAVADLQSGVDLFVRLLGARIESLGTRPDHRWMDLTWGDPLGLRLIAPLADHPNSRLNGWLQGRTGRVHHLHFEVAEPQSIPGAQRCTPDSVGYEIDASQEWWTINPSQNAGLRLLLTEKT